MKLASIERVISKKPIEGADRIELVNVLGWYVVCSKDMFEVGDLVVFIPIDTTINAELSYFRNFKKEGSQNRVRIKTAKIRGVYSEGLIIQIPDDLQKTFPDLKEGDNVGEFLDVQKYEKEVSHPTNQTTSSLTIPFPTHLISKTDEDNLRSKILVLDELRECGEVYITLKMDGSSMTLIKSSDELLICSRNWVVDDTTPMYKYAENEGLFERLVMYGKNIAIQGEFCGPKINGNKLQLKDYKYYVFTIKNLDENRFLDYDEIKQVCDDLSLSIVQTLKEMDGSELTLELLQTIANDVKYDTASKKDVLGEGIVIRPKKVLWSHVLQKPLSVKVINQKYKD